MSDDPWLAGALGYEVTFAGPRYSEDCDEAVVCTVMIVSFLSCMSTLGRCWKYSMVSAETMSRRCVLLA
jgi:hypothetical protein